MAELDLDSLYSVEIAITPHMINKRILTIYHTEWQEFLSG